jgi:hypothetical protein
MHPDETRNVESLHKIIPHYPKEAGRPGSRHHHHYKTQRGATVIKTEIQAPNDVTK